MDSEKYCYYCKQVLPLSVFGNNKSKKDGLSTECRLCKQISDQRSHLKHRESRLAKMREYQNANKEKLNEKSRQYSRSDIGRENNNRATRKYYSGHKESVLRKCKLRNINNPEKYIAEYTVSNAIKLGKIIRPEICQKCNKSGRTEAHHPDYSKVFDVLWLCKRCHGKEHRKVR